jgi:putative protein-disulfide isomerase
MPRAGLAHSSLNPPILWYFADPMCSWCWGFSPVIEALREQYHERFKIALVLGGLRPGATTPLAASGRADILHHWRQVEARTGQPFRYDGALPDGFIYDTEPACRAVVAAGRLDPALTFAMFHSIQSAFYAAGRDVTQAEVLASLADVLGADATAFLAMWNSDEARRSTLAHFRQARQAGVGGFPTLIMQQDARLASVSQGCQPLASVRAAIDRCLDA